MSGIAERIEIAKTYWNDDESKFLINVTPDDKGLFQPNSLEKLAANCIKKQLYFVACVRFLDDRGFYLRRVHNPDTCEICKAGHRSFESIFIIARELWHD